MKIIEPSFISLKLHIEWVSRAYVIGPQIRLKRIALFQPYRVLGQV